MKYDVIIIGAGAAGLMCAIEAGKRGKSVLILEKANKAGKKILISGGGRCNFTNMYSGPDNFLSQNPHFCKSALSRYTPWDFIALLESHGLSWAEKTLGQLFCDQKSPAVVKLLLDECSKVGVEIALNTECLSVDKDQYFEIKTPQNSFTSHALVIASGGPSIPKMGATDYALHIAKQFELKTIAFTAALVPFTFTLKVLDSYIKELSGLSTPVEIGIEIPEKVSKSGGVSFKENILFTHRGISGPAALQISSYWQDGDSLVINLFPDTHFRVWFEQQKSQHPNAELKTILAYKLPKRLAQKLCSVVIDPCIANKTAQQCNTQDLQKLEQQICTWTLTPSGTEGMRTAEVSLGGVDTDELSSKTMESKKIPNLYFVGEAVDVTGHLGGHNFQWAWASGWSAGQAL